MKLSKKIIIFLIVLIASLFTVTGYTLADNEEYKLGVMLKQDETNDKVVHVMLGMTDLDSIASFQLGLDMNLNEKVNAKFTFNSNLSESKYKDASIKDIPNSENKNIKRLNIYYVGTKELNPIDSNKIEIGTITFEGTTQKNALVKIEPEKDFSTIASVSHKSTSIDVDALDTVINKQDTNTQDGNNNQNQNNGDKNNSSNGSSSTEKNDSQNNVNGNNSNKTPGGSSNDNIENSSNKNGKDGSKIYNFIDLINTGANKSLTWVIYIVVVLIIIALIIIKLKNKQKDKNI